MVKQYGKEYGVRAGEEMALLRQITALNPGPSVPRFLSCDPQHNLLAITDLGDHPDLGWTLGTSRALAVMRQLGQAYAALHGLGPLPANDAARAEAEAAIPILRDRLSEWSRFARARVDIDAALADPLWERMRAPGEWNTVTHGDPAPSNTLVSNEVVVGIVDFELAGNRHALWDPTAYDILWPLDEELLAALAAGYREAAGGGRRHDLGREWARVVTFRALLMLAYIGPKAAHRGHDWAPGWSMRSAVKVALERGRVAAIAADLAYFAQLFEQLRNALQRRWVDGGADLPVWPSASP